jgi:hypothetical protein
MQLSRVFNIKDSDVKTLYSKLESNKNFNKILKNLD